VQTSVWRPTILIVLSRVGVTVDGVLDWMIGFIAPYTFTTRDYRQYSAVAHFAYLPVHRYTRTMILSLH
jgi:membrane protein YqaA with SNARE-associated domain